MKLTKTATVLVGLLLIGSSNATTFQFNKSIRQLKPVDLQAPTAPTSGIVLGVNGRAYFDGTYAQSCQAYLTGMGAYTYSGDTGDGVYIIQPLGQQATPVTCDMTRSGGGWTLVLSGPGGNSGANVPTGWRSVNAINTNSVITAQADPAQKLADAFINAIPSKGGARYMFDVQYSNYAPVVRFVGQKVYNHIGCGASVAVTSYANVELTASPLKGSGSYITVCGLNDYSWSGANYNFFVTNYIYTGLGVANLHSSVGGHLAMWVR